MHEELLSLEEFLSLTVANSLSQTFTHDVDDNNKDGEDDEWTVLASQLKPAKLKDPLNISSSQGLCPLTPQQIISQSNPEFATPVAQCLQDNSDDISQQLISPISPALLGTPLPPPDVMTGEEDYDYMDDDAFLSLPSQLKASPSDRKPQVPLLPNEEENRAEFPFSNHLIDTSTIEEREKSQSFIDFSSNPTKADYILPSTGLRFATASGKKIKSPSKEATKRALEILQDSQEKINISPPPFKSNHLVPSKSGTLPPPSFSTASGKRIKSPSKQALDRAQSIWREEEKGEPSNQLEMSFATASGKRLKSPSKEALHKAQAIWNDIDTTSANHPPDGSKFTTASGKTLKSPSKASKDSALIILSSINDLGLNSPKTVGNDNGTNRARQKNGVEIFNIANTDNAIDGRKLAKPRYLVSRAPTKGVTLGHSEKPLGNPSLFAPIFGEKASKGEKIPIHTFNGPRKTLRDFNHPRRQPSGIKNPEFGFLQDTEFWGTRFHMASRKWIENHLQHILWKLLSYHQLQIYSDDFITISKATILKQLDYRYSREFGLAQRSVLKKICERDENPARYLILYVSDIVDNATNPTVLISDGWYKLSAAVDSQFINLIHQRKIQVGTKLKMAMCQILSNDACDILEAEEHQVKLKINSNSIAPARWHNKLGSQKAKIFVKSLNSLTLEGGMVCCISVRILRIYPTIYTVEYQDGLKRMCLEEKLEEFIEEAHEKMKKIEAIKLSKRYLVEDASGSTNKIRAYVTVWDGSRSEQQSEFHEGSAIFFFNLKIGAHKKNNLIQLFTSKSSYMVNRKVVNCLSSPYWNPVGPNDMVTFYGQTDCDLAGMIVALSKGFCWILSCGESLRGPFTFAIKYPEKRLDNLGVRGRIIFFDVTFLYMDPRYKFPVFLFSDTSQFIVDETKIKGFEAGKWFLGLSEAKIMESIGFVNRIVKRASFP